jgi:hypothetical protein
MALWDHLHPGIEIDDSDAAFFADASRDLNLLRSKPLGKDLLSLISKRCSGIGTKVTNGRVFIRKSLGTISGALKDTAGNPDAFDKIFRDGKAIPGTPIQIAGKGSSSVASYNPQAEPIYTSAVGIYTPEFIALAHELCHCLHFLSGDLRAHANPGIMRLHEEARTMGVGIYAQNRISENAIRKEWGFTRFRTYYSTPGDCDGLVGH